MNVDRYLNISRLPADDPLSLDGYISLSDCSVTLIAFVFFCVYSSEFAILCQVLFYRSIFFALIPDHPFQQRKMGQIAVKQAVPFCSQQKNVHQAV